jgi:hypothetical protein
MRRSRRRSRTSAEHWPSAAPGGFCLAESARPTPAASVGSTCDADQTDPSPVLIAKGLLADHTLAAIQVPQPKLVNIGHELGTAFGVIDFSRAPIVGMKSGPDKAIRQIAPDDHEIRITSLAFLSSACSNNSATFKVPD